ncbi:hypothetical protein MSG28_008441 [Choristoneura fumiferana]|uniref:Uncharacterized protein n=1 Tax=Choristoneura fumiferana TaxID=7141 RepID=A0ACC0J5Z4_CHOFU|nr:hypothetical protein MSG28_008441 [Choristoneura fumiferana]
MGPLLVLLWKHLLVRKRRFIHTPVEWLSPIVFLVILFANKDIFFLSNGLDKYNEAKITVWGLHRELYDEEKLVRNMQTPVKKFNEGREKGYCPYTHSTPIMEFTEKMQNRDIIVIFQNVNGTWPRKLQYTIRMKTDFNTHSRVIEEGSFGPHERFGTDYEPFMRLQWAIDTSYLYLLTGADINQTLMIQEFPYWKAKENSEVAMLCYLLELLCPLSLILVFVFLISKLLDEKNTGIQELVKMVGVSPNTLCLSHFINALPAGLVYAVVGAALLGGSARPMLPHTSVVLVFIALLLHFATVVALAFAFAYVIDTTQYITTISVFVYSFTWLPFRWLETFIRDSVQSRALVTLTGLLPHVPMQWFWQEVAAREKYDRGVSFLNMAEASTLKNGSVLLALVFMLLQTALFLLLAWYLSLVRPGKYGQALPWSFPFNKQYWSKTPKVETIPAEESQLNSPDAQYFEKAPKGLPIGIQIQNITKAFPRHVALSDVTLDIYKGEITVLLGHNGAGKTTLMSIITGLMSPTSGRVLVNGKDTRSQQKEVRSQLGLCPQHNLFFSDLTVLEHVMFFTLIKGGTYGDARVSAENLLKKLNLQDKIDARTDQLSGGMKRRLQLACALAGGASVLVLDEPTSGLDVETRRELWDLLLVRHGAAGTLAAAPAGCTGRAHQGAGRGDPTRAVGPAAGKTWSGGYTGGRRQRAVLDEPTSGLDVETRRELWDLLLVRHGAAGTLAGGASGLYWTSPPAGWTWRPDASCGGGGYALAGGASGLFWTSTAWLDVETRRELWDLLVVRYMEAAGTLSEARRRAVLRRAVPEPGPMTRSLRGDRTVLLTTHFMEEADALGDRVAALHAGQLRCHATTMFLKKAVGTGYRLSFTTIGPPNEPAITAAIRASIPDATVRDEALHALSYNLPSKDCSQFPTLFSNLEEKRSELGIDSIGVGKSTLDEVFLRLCSDVHTSFANEQTDTIGADQTFEKLTGAALYARQFAVLIMRQVHYITSKLSSFIILQVILPILFLFLMTKLSNDADYTHIIRNNETAMDLDLYRDMAQKRVLFNIHAVEALPALRNAYKNVDFEVTNDVAEAMLRTGVEDILEYNKYLVGIELNDTDAKALYTTIVRHAAPVAVNLMSNILASQLVGGADARTIPHKPPHRGLVRCHRGRESRAAEEPDDAAALGVLLLFASLISVTTLPCKERVTGTRHIHQMCGCSLVLYWAATLAAHFCQSLLLLVLPTVVAPLLFDTDHTLDQGGFLAVLTVILVVGVLAFSAVAYLLSTGLTERSVGAALTVATVVFSFITPAMHLAAITLQRTSGFTFALLQLSRLVAPPHTAALAIGKAGAIARLNALCTLNRDKCPAIVVFEKGFDVNKCCESSSDPVSYFSMDDQAPGMEMIIMAIQFVVYAVLLILAERGVFAHAWDQVSIARMRRPKARFNDAMVRAENAYVEKAIQLPKKQINDAMLCYDVYKNYPALFKKSCFAVNGISFSVKKGECFGLLGVNGAGKSTTFKMLAGEVRPSRGTMFAHQHHLEDRTQYMRTLSYCPQFFGLDDFLTGRQNLELVLTLRGLRPADVIGEASSWIEEVGELET